MDDSGVFDPRARRSPVRRLGRRWRTTIVVGAVVLVLGACSSAGDNEATDTSPANETAPSTTAVIRPEGPSADITEELTGGKGIFIGSAQGAATASGYVEQEYVAAGTATAYGATGDLTTDGRWTLDPAPAPTTGPASSFAGPRRPTTSAAPSSSSG